MSDCLYTPALAETVCKRIAQGESLRAICRDSGMPTEGAVRGWARDNRDGFGARYRLARELQFEFWADQIVEIADASEADPCDPQVRIDVRKWLLSKLAARRYGERLLVAGEPENPIRVLHEQVGLDRLTSDQLASLEIFAQAMVQKQREPA